MGVLACSVHGIAVLVDELGVLSALDVYKKETPSKGCLRNLCKSSSFYMNNSECVPNRNNLIMLLFSSIQISRVSLSI